MSNVLSCYWKVHINGSPLDEQRMNCIDSIDLLQQCNGSDTCSIKVNDPDFVFINDNIFIEEAKVSVEMGWYGDTYRETFTGYISAIDIDFPQDGYPTLSIFCLDDSHVMNRKKKKRSWDNVTRAEVVEKIAKEYGFKCVIESGYSFERIDTISQSDVTDIEFCENLAGEERDLFMCKLVGNTLYYVKMGLLKNPSTTLYYKKYPHDVVSFSPRINKETRKAEASSADISTSNKTTDSHTSNNSNTDRDVQGGSVSDKENTPSSTSTAGMKYNTTTGKWEEVK